MKPAESYTHTHTHTQLNRLRDIFNVQCSTPSGVSCKVQLSDKIINYPLSIINCFIALCTLNIAHLSPAYADNILTSKSYVDKITGTLLSKTGGTVTGALILSGDPTTDMQAVTKKYVDDRMMQSPEEYTLPGTGILANTVKIYKAGPLCWVATVMKTQISDTDFKTIPTEYLIGRLPNRYKAPTGFVGFAYTFMADYAYDIKQTLQFGMLSIEIDGRVYFLHYDPYSLPANQKVRIQIFGGTYYCPNFDSI